MEDILLIIAFHLNTRDVWSCIKTCTHLKTLDNELFWSRLRTARKYKYNAFHNMQVWPWQLDNSLVIGEDDQKTI